MRVLVTYVIDTETGTMSAPQCVSVYGVEALVQPLDPTGHEWAVAETSHVDDVALFTHQDTDTYLNLALDLARIAERHLRAKRESVLSVPCPRCGAEACNLCVGKALHAARREAHYKARYGR